MNEVRFWGGAALMDVVVDAEGQWIHPWQARVWHLYSVDGKNGVVRMPNATTLRLGGPQVFIINTSGEDIDLQDSEGGAIITMMDSTITTVHLRENAQPEGIWATSSKAVNAATKWLSAVNGIVVGGSTSAVRLYTEVGGTWSAGSAPPNAHAEGGAMPLDRAAYVVGDSPTPSLKNDELRGGAWTNRLDSPFATGKQIGGGRAGTGWIYAGDSTPSVASYTFNAWTSRRGFGWPMTRGVARTIADRTYIVAGEPVPSPPKAHKMSVDAYYGITALSSPSRYGLTAFNLHGKLVVAGGKSDVGPTWYDNVDEYNRTTDAWTARTAITGGARHRAAGWGANSKGYVAGGRDNADSVIGTVYSFKANAWTSLTGMGTALAETHNTSFNA